jgi:hypothetical protein
MTFGEWLDEHEDLITKAAVIFACLAGLMALIIAEVL